TTANRHSPTKDRREAVPRREMIGPDIRASIAVVNLMRMGLAAALRDIDRCGWHLLAPALPGSAKPLLEACGKSVDLAQRRCLHALAQTRTQFGKLRDSGGLADCELDKGLRVVGNPVVHACRVQA